MPLKRLRVFRRLPLQAAITIPFVLLVAAAVGMIGYLSYRNSQATVNALAFQLRSELTARILQQLEDTVSHPNVINQINASALLRGNLDLLTGKGEHQLWQQMQVFPAINLIYCATEADGAFLGVGRSQGGIGNSLQVQVANPSTNRYFHFFDVDDQGQRLGLSRIDGKLYDPRLRPWYKAAKTRGEPTWSEVYLDFETLLPTITANVPVYHPGSRQLLGVCAADVILSKELNTFLQNLDISPSGMAFIVDTSGLLIASSTPEPITAGAGEDTVLLRASDSSNRLIRGGVAYLRGQYQSLDQVQSSQLEFVQAKERYFLQVSRFTDDLGLDWVLVLMVPEEDFMAPIHHQNRVTFVLYVLSLLLATAFGLLLANWVIRPLHQLSDRASEIAQGNWHDPIELERSDAIGQLSRSLATMARQLKESLTTLEQRVEERNQELTQVNQELQKLAHSDGLTQTANRRYFDTVIKREWQRLSREQQPMALMLCDVDYFKRYNDTYGHQAGDQCLREVAQVLGQTSRRPADLVARYGGEEFALILPNTSLQGAVCIAENIQAHLQKLTLPHKASPIGRITISIGIAVTIPSIKNSPKDLLKTADQALYNAKANGRNRFSIDNYGP